MKKLIILGLFICCFLFTGCGQKLGENESIYEGELIVAGVGPEISFEPTVEEGTLVLKGYFEYHSDHIFLTGGIWESYFTKKSEYLPGNTIKFKGVVKALDAAAGNHYYEVKSIDKLELLKYPDVNEIKDILESYNYCESDSDCTYFGGECPLGCYIPLNIKYVDIAPNIVSNFINHLDERCIYDCIAFDKVVCENYKCEMKSSEEYKEIITCTPEQKDAENCNMIYYPVCGSDSRTYGNSCVACQSETVESYTQGECESSTFVVEGATKYYDYVMDYFQEAGGVTCDFKYSFDGEQLSGKLVADEERFYSIRDDYFEGNIDYGYSTLVINNKTYNRIASEPRDGGTVFNFSSQPDSEIASLLLTLGEYPDFEIECQYGIADQSIFDIPEEIDFS